MVVASCNGGNGFKVGGPIRLPTPKKCKGTQQSDSLFCCPSRAFRSSREIPNQKRQVAVRPVGQLVRLSSRNVVFLQNRCHLVAGRPSQHNDGPIIRACHERWKY